LRQIFNDDNSERGNHEDADEPPPNPALLKTFLEAQAALSC
jgi:hypothetical protein